jgi:hypothetical protein
LDKRKADQLHDAISGQGYGYQQVLRIAREMFR